MTDYQNLFIKKMGYIPLVQGNRTFFTPNASNGKGYLINYEPNSYYQFVVANYLITENFELDFNSNDKYLRFGIIEKGVSTYKIKGKAMKDFTPSPFIVMENNISGNQSWTSGQHYKGTEFILHMDLLKKNLMKTYPTLKALKKLRENFIYYYLPESIIEQIETLKREALSNSLTHLKLDSTMLTILSTLVENLELETENPFENQYNYSISGYGKGRNVRITQSDVDAIKKIRQEILKSLSNPPTLSELRKKYFIGEQKMTVGFKKLYGQSIGQYMIDQKLLRAAGLLTTTDKPIHDIAIEVGYVNTSNFAKAFKNKYQKSPLQYRKAYH